MKNSMNGHSYTLATTQTWWLKNTNIRREFIHQYNHNDPSESFTTLSQDVTDGRSFYILAHALNCIIVCNIYCK